MACSSGGDKRFTSPSNSALGHRLSWQFARVDGRYGRCNMLKHTVLCYLAKTFPDGMRFSPHLGGNIAFLDHWFHPPCLSHPQCAFQPSPVSAKKHLPPDGATCGHLSDMSLRSLPWSAHCSCSDHRSCTWNPWPAPEGFFSHLFKFLKKICAAESKKPAMIYLI